MAFDLPSANQKYSQTNENQARRATEDAIRGILARLEQAEKAVAEGVGSVEGPTASFSQVIDDLDVVFTDTSVAGDAAIDTWAWTFGDGSTSSSQNPSHTYASAGEYTVTLTVTDANGKSSAAQLGITVQAAPAGPTANFTFVTSGLTATFTNTSLAGSSSIVSRSWLFGDGQTSTATNPSHTYASAGSRSVTLTVVDANGLSDQVTKSVAVTAPSGAPLLVGAYQSPVGAAPGSDADVSSGYYTLNLGLNGDPATIAAEIAEARTKGIKIFYNFAGPRAAWIPGGTYDPAIYESKVRRFQNIAAVAAGVADGTVGAYLGDEFYLFNTYHGSVSPRDMNDMGLLHKSIWPGILTAVRVSGQQMNGGWSNTDGVASPPPGGYTGLDYSISQFERAAFNQKLSIQAWYARERTILGPMNVGIIPALNWAGSGPNTYVQSPDCWDYLSNGSSSGVVGGAEDTVGAGVIKQCSDPAKDDFRFRIGNPALITEFFNYCATQADFAGAAFWTYPRDGFSWSSAIQPYYYSRENIKQAFRDAITTGKNRTGGNGWRTAK